MMIKVELKLIIDLTFLDCRILCKFRKVKFRLNCRIPRHSNYIPRSRLRGTRYPEIGMHNTVEYPATWTKFQMNKISKWRSDVICAGYAVRGTP